MIKKQVSILKCMINSTQTFNNGSHHIKSSSSKITTDMGHTK